MWVVAVLTWKWITTWRMGRNSRFYLIDWKEKEERPLLWAGFPFSGCRAHYLHTICQIPVLFWSYWLHDRQAIRYYFSRSIWCPGHHKERLLLLCPGRSGFPYYSRSWISHQPPVLSHVVSTTFSEIQLQCVGGWWVHESGFSPFRFSNPYYYSGDRRTSLMSLHTTVLDQTFSVVLREGREKHEAGQLGPLETVLAEFDSWQHGDVRMAVLVRERVGCCSM